MFYVLSLKRRTKAREIVQQLGVCTLHKVNSSLILDTSYGSNLGLPGLISKHRARSKCLVLLGVIQNLNNYIIKVVIQYKFLNPVTIILGLCSS